MSPANSGAGDFAGVYIQANGTVAGAELSGKYKDNDGVLTEGTAGKVFPLAGGEIGFNVPLGEVFILSVGYSQDPVGQQMGESNDAFDEADVRLTVSDVETTYGAIGFSIGEGQAFFVKYGEIEADIRCTVGATCPSGLSGDLYALGTKSLTSSGIYFTTEAGVADFDKMAITNLGKGNNGSIDADPNMAFGKFSIGYNF